MKKWDDLGNGQWRLTITDDKDANARPVVVKGTKDEIIEKLADSKLEGNRYISQLRSQSPAPPPAAPAPSNGTKPLTAAERMQVAADITNPGAVDTAVTRVIESVIGPVKELQRDRAAEREERAERAAVAAVNAFMAQTPEYYRTPHNNQLLVEYMKTYRLDNSKVESYTHAFERLSAVPGLLQVAPLEDETTTEVTRNGPEPTAPTPRAAPTSTRFSTSVRSSDISGRAPEPNRTPRLKYTREQLQNLSASEYKRLMQTDGKELARCEDYYAKTPVRRAG